LALAASGRGRPQGAPPPISSQGAPTPISSQGALLVGAIAPHPLRILLADDNLTNQQVTRRLLAGLGQRADVAASGIEVLEALERQPYDLVLMDVQMPAMSGADATRAIRTRWPPERQPRIAAITAYASEAQRAWLLDNGMDDYLAKPVRLEELARVLQAAAPHVPRSSDSPSFAHSPDDSTAALDPELFALFLAGVGEDDPALEAAFVADYVAELGAQLQLLREALLRADSVSCTRVAHTLRGLSLQIGALELARCCERIEAAACGAAFEHRTSIELLRGLAEAYAAVQRASQAPHPLRCRVFGQASHRVKDY